MTAMDSLQEKQSTIFIPTKNSIAMRHVGEHLVSSRVPVIILGPSNTGKTSLVESLAYRQRDRFIHATHTLLWSTRACNTESYVRSRLESKGPGVLGPKGKDLLLFIDDVHAVSSSGPCEFVRQIADSSGVWETEGKRSRFLGVSNVALIAAGQHSGHVSDRALRHFHVLCQLEPTCESMQAVFCHMYGGNRYLTALKLRVFRLAIILF